MTGLKTGSPIFRGSKISQQNKVFVFNIISNLEGPVDEGGLTPRAWIPGAGRERKGFLLELQPGAPCNLNPLLMLGSNLLQVMKIL